MPAFPSSASLLGRFSALSDPRQRWRAAHPPSEIFLLVLCATPSPHAKAFAAAARAHRGVENRLSWTLDVVFHDDLLRLRSGNDPQNMALIGHMAMNILAMNIMRNPKDRRGLKVRRKLANPNADCLEALIRQPPTLS